MTPLTELLAPIKERLEKATPGPWWKDNKGSLPYESRVCDLMSNNIHAEVKVDFETDKANVELIANAPTDLAKLIRAVERLSEALNNYAAMNYSGFYGGKYAAAEALKRAEEILK